MAEARDIGGNWMEAYDEASGHYYYANTETGETRWEWPDDVPKPEEGEAERIGPWVKGIDPGSGAEYWFNEETQESSWERPVVEEAADPAAAAAAAAAKEEAAAAPEPAPAPAPAAEPAPAPAPAAEPAPAPAPAAEPAPAPAPAAATAGPGGVSTLSTGLRMKLMGMLNYARMEAKKALTAGGNADKFANLRKFAAVGAQKRAEATAKRRAAEKRAAAATDAVTNAERAAALIPLVEQLELQAPPVAEIPDKDMAEYAETYFNLNRKGMFGKKTTVDKVLRWKKDLIKRSLLSMPTSELDSVARQCFKNLTGFMGDRDSGKEGGGHAEKLLRNILSASGEMRDEVYCQLIKQTTSNEEPRSLTRGWQLFVILACAFPPSDQLRPYLLAYLNAHRSDSEVHDGTGVTSGEYASAAIARIEKNAAVAPRREVPIPAEIEASGDMQPVLVRVYHVTGDSEFLPIMSWTTAEDMNRMMALKLGIKNSEPFAVYEVTPQMEERYLEPNERIVDLVAYWQRLFEEEKVESDKKRDAAQRSYRFVYKVHRYYDSAEDDRHAAHQMYRQALYDVVSSRYPASDEECLRLAGIQLQVEFGPGGFGITGETLHHFLPKRMCDNAEKVPEYISSITEEHEKQKGNTRTQAQALYLEIVRAMEVYGSSFFFVEPQMSVDLPTECFLAVSPAGILVIHPETKEVLKRYEYSELPTWGHSGSTFVLHVGNLLKQDKLYFQTEDGSVINALIRDYVQHLVETS